MEPTGDPWLDEYYRTRGSDIAGEDPGPTTAPADAQLPPAPSITPAFNPFAADVTAPVDASTVPSAESPSLIGRAWDTITSPVKAAVGLSGTSAIHALGIPQIFPEAYEKAAAERRASITGGIDRPLGPLESAEALPGLGDVITANWQPDSLTGRIARPIVQLAGDIGGDPMTYAGPGLARLTKVGRTYDAVKAAALGADALRAEAGVADAAKAAGLMGRAADYTKAVPHLEGYLDAARAGESTGARFGRLALGAAALPYGPIGGLAYAPGIIESTAHSAQNAWEEAKAGRYANAAASGVGALVTAALGSLVAKGLVDEHHAAGVLERTLAETIGDKAGAGLQPPPDVRMPDQTPMQAPTTPQAPTQEGAAPGVAPQVAEPASSFNGGAAAQPSPVSAPPTRPVYEPGTDLHAKQQAALKLIDGLKPGDPLPTKAELIAAGIVSKNKARDGNVPGILTAVGLPDIAARAEAVPGRPHRLMAEPGAAAGEQAGAEVQSVPEQTPAAEPAVEEAPVTAPAEAPPIAAPVPTAPLTGRAAIESRLADQPHQERVARAIAEIGAAADKPFDQLTPDDVRTHWKPEMPERGDLNHVIQRTKVWMREEAKRKAAAGESVEPAPSTSAQPGQEPVAAAPGPAPTVDVPASATAGEGSTVPVPAAESSRAEPAAVKKDSERGTPVYPTHGGNYPKRRVEPDVLGMLKAESSRVTSGEPITVPSKAQAERIAADRQERALDAELGHPEQRPLSLSDQARERLAVAVEDVRRPSGHGQHFTEDRLQNSAVKMLEIAEGRYGKRGGGQDLKPELDRLLNHEPDAAVAQKEIAKLIQTDLLYQKKQENRSGMNRDRLDRVAAAQGLDAAESERFAGGDDLGHALQTKEAPADHPGLPARPDAMTPEQWAKHVPTDERLQEQYREAVQYAGSKWLESKTTRTGGPDSEHMQIIRQIADDLGVKYDRNRAFDRIARAVLKKIDPEAHASATGELGLLNIERWLKERSATGVKNAVAIGDTGTHVADLLGDSPEFSQPLAKISAPISDALSTAMNTISESLDMPSRFAGIVASPRLNGARVGEDIYLNVLHAMHEARRSTSDSPFTGAALSESIADAAATRLVDEGIHEIIHAAVRHDVATNDAEFTAAYADASRIAGQHRLDAIRAVSESIRQIQPELEKMAPAYDRAVEGARDGAGAGFDTGLGAEPGPRPDAGTGPRRIAPIPDRPGRDTRSVAGGARDGARPGGAVSGGVGESRPAVPEATTAREGAAEQPASGQPGAGPDSTSTHASITDDVKAAISAERQNTALQSFRRAFVDNFIRYSGLPVESADSILAKFDRTRTLPDTAREALQQAGPQRDFNIGINLSKIDPEAMSPAQREVVALSLWMRGHAKEFARDTPMSYANVDADMRSLLKAHTPEEFTRNASKAGLKTPADFAAARTIYATFAQDVDNARAAINAAEKAGGSAASTPAALETARENLSIAWAKQTAIGDILINGSTNSAREMAFMRTIAHPLSPAERFESRFLGAMRAAKIKDAQSKQLYSMFKDIIANGADFSSARGVAFTDAFRAATNPTKLDKIMEFWKAGLLGWTTQVAKIGSDTTFFTLRQADTAAAILYDQFASKITGAPRTRNIGELSARMIGLRHGLRDAWPVMKETLSRIAHLEPPDIQDRLSTGAFQDDPGVRRLYGAIPGKPGEFVRIPFKLMDAGADFAKHISRMQELAMSAQRMASDSALRAKLVGPGQTVESATATIFNELRRVSSDPFSNNHLYQKPGYKAALEAANKIALEDTAQTPLSGTMKAFADLTHTNPALEFLFPFIKTPYNLLSSGMERTPLGMAWAAQKYTRGQISNPEFVSAMLKGGVGSLIMGATASMALDGSVTGGGPADPKERELLERTGWQPYSFRLGPAGKTGTEYISYQRLEPIATMLGIAADLAEGWKHKDTTSTADQISKGVASIKENITNKTFLTGLDALVKFMGDPHREGATAIRQWQASMIPNVVGVVPVAHLARAIDPDYRETEAFTASPFMAQIPGLSSMLQPQMTPAGEIRKRPGTPIERIFSPFQRSEERTDPIADAAREVSRLGMPIESTPLFFKVGESKVYYTPEERQAIADAQQTAMEKIASVIDSPSYDRLPDHPELATQGHMTKVARIKQIIAKYHDPITQRMRHQAAQREKSLDAE